MSSSSSSSSSSSAGGVGFLGALTIAFIVLKILGFIDWSWWWVLAPLWSPFALAVVVALLWLGWSLRKEHQKVKYDREYQRLRREQLIKDIQDKENRFAGS